MPTRFVLLASATMLCQSFLFSQSTPSSIVAVEPNPTYPSSFIPDFRAICSSPGVCLFAGQPPGVDAFMGIHFVTYTDTSPYLRAGIAGRSGGNWGALSFFTQDGSDGQVYERVRIDSQGYVGIGTINPQSPLTVNGVIESVSGGVKFPDGSVQTTAATGDRSSVESLNGLAGSVSLKAGANVSISTTGSNIVISAQSSQQFATCVSYSTAVPICGCSKVVSAQNIFGGASCTTSAATNQCKADSSAGCPGCIPRIPVTFGLCCVCQ
jgi:hypothetical protein